MLSAEHAFGDEAADTEADPAANTARISSAEKTEREYAVI
jgi:hypothetical protein